MGKHRVNRSTTHVQDHFYSRSYHHPESLPLLLRVYIIITKKQYLKIPILLSSSSLSPRHIYTLSFIFSQNRQLKPLKSEFSKSANTQIHSTQARRRKKNIEKTEHFGVHVQ